MKALEILKNTRVIYTDEFIDEAIKELEELIKPKRCNECKYYHSFTEICSNDECPLCADFVHSDFGCIHYSKKIR